MYKTIYGTVFLINFPIGVPNTHKQAQKALKDQF